MAHWSGKEISLGFYQLLFLQPLWIHFLIESLNNVFPPQVVQHIKILLFDHLLACILTEILVLHMQPISSSCDKSSMDSIVVVIQHPHPLRLPTATTASQIAQLLYLILQTLIHIFSESNQYSEAAMNWLLEVQFLVEDRCSSKFVSILITRFYRN